MVAGTTTSVNGQAQVEKQSGKALKRGDACLACRKRRIRCDAEKPACATCARLGKDCVYVTSKPISKMQRLKQRIVALEGHIAETEGVAPEDCVPDSSRHSSDSLSDPRPNEPFVSTSGVNTPQLPFSFDGQTINPSALSAFLPADMENVELSSRSMARYTQTFPPMPALGHGLQPFLPQTTNPHPLQQPDPNFEFDFGLLDTDMMDLAGAFAQVPAVPNAMPNTLSMLGAAGPFESCSSQLPKLIDQSSELRVDSVTDNGWSSQFDPSLRAELAGPGEIIGGWYDPTDIPPHVRDHLLDLFFSQGSIFASMFDIPRFYASLTLPPAKRPHPALLYSIYLMAARRSSSPKLKALEPKFCEVVEHQINEGNRRNDRLLDLTQALVLFVNYLVTIEAYNIAYAATGLAVRLAMICGLHRIPSGIWQPPRTMNHALMFLMRVGHWNLDSPNDPTELGIRIHTFWAVFQLDFSISIAHVWEPILRPETITTPLPRPLEEYSLNLVTHKDDVTLHSFLQPPPSGTLITPSHDTFLISSVKTWGFINKAASLRDSPPEVIVDVTPSAGLATGRMATGSASLEQSHPTAFGNLKMAIDHYCDTLPIAFRLPWQRWEDGQAYVPPQQKVPDLVSKLWFLIGYAYLHLLNIRTLTGRNDKAVRVARRLVGFVLGSSSICEAWRGYDMFFILIWNDIAMVLLREMKRIEFGGTSSPEDDPAGVAADFDLVLEAIKSWSLLNVKSKHGTADIAAINWQMLDAFKPMSQETWLGAAQEAMERFK